MRIGIMCHASFGGSARIATGLALALARRGHWVHVFSRTTPLGGWDPMPNVVLHTMYPEAAETRHPATLHTNWSEAELRRYAAAIVRIIGTEGLDVLHFHYAVPFAFVAQRLRHQLGEAAPCLIGTLHGTDVTHCGHDAGLGLQVAEALRALDVVTAVSASHAELATTVFGLATPPMVIPNFVDLTRFRPPASARTPEGPRWRPRIAHVSNFRPIKDPQSMARIFLGIRARMQAELWLIGSGEELATVQGLFQQSAFADDVTYLGLQREVAPFLMHTDLLLMTSLYESFCLVALEAMACGVPVVAAEVGGLAEVVVHGRTGLLFPRHDQGLAVDLAVGLLSDPARHRAMRQAAIQHARRFSDEHIVPAYEALYAQGAYAGSPE